MRTLVFTAFALGATVADSKSLLRGSADPKTLMHRPSQMIGIPAPEGSNFFHPDGFFLGVCCFPPIFEPKIVRYFGAV